MRNQALPFIVSALAFAGCASSAPTSETSGSAPRPAAAAAAAAAPAAESESASTDAPKLQFGWLAGDRALVSMTSEASGRRLDTKYILFVEAAEDGLLMAPRNFEVDGQVDEQTLQSAAAQAAPYRISPKGEWVGLADTDAAITQMGDLLPAEDAALYRKAVETPQIRSMLSARMVDEWGMWVQTWLGTEVRKYNFSFEADTPIGDKSVKAPTKVDVAPLGGGDKIRLTMKSRLSGAEASRAIAELSMKMALQNASSDAEKAQVRKTFTGIIMERRTTIEAVLDAKSMRPDKVSMFSNTTVIAKGRKRERIDKKNWTFRWKIAEPKQADK